MGAGGLSSESRDRDKGNGASSERERARFERESPPAPTATPYDSATKVNPPLRGWSDVRALWEGLADGTVDAIATDHAPHASVKKNVEFDQAAFGISGLETALSLVLGGVNAGWCDRDTAIRALTTGPAARARYSRCATSDWIAIDLDEEWIVSADDAGVDGEEHAATRPEAPRTSRVRRGWRRSSL